MECLPEEALEIGHVLEIPSVVRAAYAILVSEKALNKLKFDGQDDVHPRALSGIPWRDLRREDLQDLVDYGATEFAERIKGVIAILQSDPAYEECGTKQ